MTESQWLAHPYPPAMVQFVEAKVSARKLRLFACACARWTWESPPDGRYLVAVETAERVADGEAPAEDLAAAYRAARRLSIEWSREHPDDPRKFILIAPADAAAKSPADAAFTAALDAGWESDADGWKSDSPRYAALAELARDVFGNPFRTTLFCPEWRTEAAVTLARQMYEARDFTEMPALAERLQEAGCDNQDILAHCRRPGPHVRGCVVVDMVLNRR